MEPRRPLVTIVNPNAPAPIGDVLESGSDVPRWRPTQRQLALGVAVLSVLIALVGTTFVVLHRRHERALDRAALADVELSAVYDQNSDSTAVKIFNNGRFPVTLLSASVDAPGYGDASPGLLGSDESGSFVLDDTRPCTPAILTAQPRLMVISGKTSRGQRFTRSIPLDSDALDATLVDDQFRCGYQSPEDSLSLEVTSVRASGKDVIVRAEIGDESVLPLTLLRFESGSNVLVTSPEAMPIVLPPARDAAGDIQGIPLTLRLHLSDCRVGSETGGGLPQALDPIGLVFVRRGRATAQTVLILEPRHVFNGEALGPAPVELLYKRACGITLPTDGAPPGG